METLLSCAGVVATIVGGAWYLSGRLSTLDTNLTGLRSDVYELTTEVLRMGGRVGQLEKKPRKAAGGAR